MCVRMYVCITTGCCSSSTEEVKKHLCLSVTPDWLIDFVPAWLSNKTLPLLWATSSTAAQHLEAPKAGDGSIYRASLPSCLVVCLARASDFLGDRDKARERRKDGLTGGQMDAANLVKSRGKDWKGKCARTRGREKEIPLQWEREREISKEK